MYFLLNSLKWMFQHADLKRIFSFYKLSRFFKSIDILQLDNAFASKFFVEHLIHFAAFVV